MRRFEDWPAHLVGVIDAAAAKPFVRGEHDCCLFACDCIAAMTGVDPAAPFRDTYWSKTGATRALKNYAGTLEEVASQIAADHGFRPITAGEAGRGDLALLESDFGDVLAIHYGGALITMAPTGLVRVPTGFARLHWAV